MRQILRNLLRCERGNVALMFGLSLLPLIGMVGAAVDYSRAADQHSRLQAAVDAATLALGKMPSSTTQAALETQANTLIKAFIKDTAVRATITTSVARSTGTIVVTANGTVSAPLVSVIGIQTVPIAATSTAKWGASRLRVALALDVTGSMNSDGKLAAMKTAATNLITQLQNAAAIDGDVYVSIIPFAKDVNVGASNYNQSWVKWSGFSGSFDSQNTGCDRSFFGFWPTTQSFCQAIGGVWGTSHSNWNGCVMDRDQSYDTTNTAPGATAATQFPAEQDPDCPAQLMPLSYDWTALKAKITALVAAGNTNQQIGLAWGFQSLTASPFVIPAMDSNYTYQQVVILLSDGLNTESRAYSNASQIDARQQILCDNMKAAPNNLTIYTVQVNTGGDPTSAVMQYCASPGKASVLTSANQIVATFAQIGIELSNLRVAY